MLFKKIKEAIEFIKNNIKDVLDFLGENSIEINIQHKETKETKKSIKISNLFFLAVLLLLAGAIFLIGRIHTLFFP